jgi:hypothetical protein
VPCSGFASLITYQAEGGTALAARAITWPPGFKSALVVDIPFGDALIREFHDEMGITIESYSIDFSHYIGPTDGVQPIQDLAYELAPFYIRHLPQADPWGNPYLIWSDPAVGYALVSYGSDGQAECAYPAWTWPAWNALYAAETPQTGRDLVFVTGQFVQWPAGVEPRPYP